VVDLREEQASPDFPGYTFRWHRDRYGRARRYLHAGPSQKALQEERERINELTDRRQGCTPIPRLIATLAAAGGIDAAALSKARGTLFRAWPVWKHARCHEKVFK